MADKNITETVFLFMKDKKGLDLLAYVYKLALFQIHNV